MGLRHYGPQLLGYLVTVTRDEDLAHECFARVCEAVWLALPRFRRESTFRTWAYRIAWSTAHEAHRERARRREQPLETSWAARLAAEIRATTQPIERSSVRDRVHALRKELTREELSLLVLRVDKQMAWREVAAVMSEDGQDLDEAAVRKRFERVSKKLRRLAGDAGLLGKR